MKWAPGPYVHTFSLALKKSTTLYSLLRSRLKMASLTGRNVANILTNRCQVLEVWTQQHFGPVSRHYFSGTLRELLSTRDNHSFKAIIVILSSFSFELNSLLSAMRIQKHNEHKMYPLNVYYFEENYVNRLMPFRNNIFRSSSHIVTERARPSFCIAVMFFIV